MLCKLSLSVHSKKGKVYSQSGMMNLCAGINRHIQNPAYNRMCDIINDATFLPANKVFTGRMRENNSNSHSVYL